MLELREENAWAAEFPVEHGFPDEGVELQWIAPAADEVVAAIFIRAGARGRTLTVEVWDSSPSRPAPRDLDPSAEGGRGLILIEALADEWGTRARIIGKTVWFRLLFPGPDPDAAVPEQRHAPEQARPSPAGI